MDAATLKFRVLGGTATIPKGHQRAKWFQVKSWQLSGGWNF